MKPPLAEVRGEGSVRRATRNSQVAGTEAALTCILQKMRYTSEIDELQLSVGRVTAPPAAVTLSDLRRIFSNLRRRE